MRAVTWHGTCPGHSRSAVVSGASTSQRTAAMMQKLGLGTQPPEPVHSSSQAYAINKPASVCVWLTVRERVCVASPPLQTPSAGIRSGQWPAAGTHHAPRAPPRVARAVCRCARRVPPRTQPPAPPLHRSAADLLLGTRPTRRRTSFFFFLVVGREDQGEVSGGGDGGGREEGEEVRVCGATSVAGNPASKAWRPGAYLREQSHARTRTCTRTHGDGG